MNHSFSILYGTDLPKRRVVGDEVAAELRVHHPRVQRIDGAVGVLREAADELVGEEDVGELGLPVRHPRLVVFAVGTASAGVSARASRHKLNRRPKKQDGAGDGDMSRGLSQAAASCAPAHEVVEVHRAKRMRARR